MSLGNRIMSLLDQIGYGLKTELANQVKRNFRAKSNSFAKGARYQVSESQGEYKLTFVLSPILSSFATGATIKGQPTLAILTEEGEQLGFRRINKKSGWGELYKKYPKALYRKGNILYYKKGRNLIPIYIFVSEVRQKRRIRLSGAAKRYLRQLPRKILRS